MIGVGLQARLERGTSLFEVLVCIAVVLAIIIFGFVRPHGADRINATTALQGAATAARAQADAAGATIVVAPSGASGSSIQVFNGWQGAGSVVYSATTIGAVALKSSSGGFYTSFSIDVRRDGSWLPSVDSCSNTLTIGLIGTTSTTLGEQQALSCADLSVGATWTS